MNQTHKMNIIPPTPKQDSDFLWEFNKVEIATIPADYSIQLSTGAITILDVKLVSGEFKSPNIIFPRGLKFASVIDYNQENKYLILSI